jgi:hypothetical protein
VKKKKNGRVQAADIPSRCDCAAKALVPSTLAECQPDRMIDGPDLLSMRSQEEG